VLSGVQKAAAELARHLFEVPGQILRLLVGPRKGIVKACARNAGGRRCNQQHLGCAAVRSEFAALDHFDERLCRAGNIPGGKTKPVLQIVGAQHQSHQVEGVVRLQDRDERALAALVLALDRIGPDGGASVQPLGDDQVIGPKIARQQRHPALFERVACLRDRIVAPRVRVTVAEDRLHRVSCSEERCADCTSGSGETEIWAQ